MHLLTAEQHNLATLSLQRMQAQTLREKPSARFQFLCLHPAFHLPGHKFGPNWIKLVGPEIYSSCHKSCASQRNPYFKLMLTMYEMAEAS